MEKKVFCQVCRNDVGFSIREKQMKGMIKGEAYFYIGKEAHCKVCGSEIYTPEVKDYNLKVLHDRYREKNGIVPLDVILAIPEKYAIGKRPLSLLLGWGEQTFSRYCDGDMPTKQYSEILQNIYADPLYYAEILESNKGNLKTAASYEKSRKAVDKILGINYSTKSKIELSIKYLLNQCEDITPFALQKALYYIQGFYYAFYKTFLFTEDCEAWIQGPVYRDIYFKYCNDRFDPAGGRDEWDGSAFSSAEKAILDGIIKNVCCFSGKVLEIFTHSEMPWLIARGALPATEASYPVIQKELIGDYFSAVKEKYNMINPKDIKGYTTAMFEQI